MQPTNEPAVLLIETTIITTNTAIAHNINDCTVLFFNEAQISFNPIDLLFR